MKLVLPPTLSAPTRDETPKTADFDATQAERAAARIEPGYRITHPESKERYTFFARVNVDAPQVWEAFEALIAAMPEPVAAVVGVHEDEPFYGPYTRKSRILATLSLYRDALARDAFLEFGLMHQTASRTEEVFVRSAKYLCVWGRDEAAFEATMRKLGLPRIDDLRFIDELPLVRRPLSEVDPKAQAFDDVVADLEERLEELPSSARGRASH